MELLEARLQPEPLRERDERHEPDAEWYPEPTLDERGTAATGAQRSAKAERYADGGDEHERRREPAGQLRGGDEVGVAPIGLGLEQQGHGGGVGKKPQDGGDEQGGAGDRTNRPRELARDRPIQTGPEGKTQEGSAQRRHLRVVPRPRSNAKHQVFGRPARVDGKRPPEAPEAALYAVDHPDLHRRAWIPNGCA